MHSGKQFLLSPCEHHLCSARERPERVHRFPIKILLADNIDTVEIFAKKALLKKGVQNLEMLH